MNRTVRWVLALTVASAGLALGVHAAEQAAPSPTGQPAASQAATPAAGDEKVAFTFADDAQLQEFGRLWQQRQAIATRMAVLQSYWDEEQASFAKANEQLKQQYNLDVNKRYDFDAARKVIIEREAIPPVAGSTPGQPTAAAQTPGSSSTAQQ